MVETSLFPRPHFSSFLQSDDAIDPLCYHNYQRLQRLQKVARLQERRARSYEPGYKKTDLSQPAMQGTSSRQIFPSLKRHDGGRAAGNAPGDVLRTEENVVSPEADWKITRDRCEETGFQSKCLPGSLNRRPTKSATVHSSRHHQQHSVVLQRPMTAANTIVKTRDIGTDVEEDERRGDVERLKESMAQTYRWTSATKRAYDEVDWRELSSPPPPPPPPSTVEHLPDPVSQKLTFRRYHSSPEPWQMYGGEWDTVQSRCGDYNSLQPFNCSSPSRNNEHIPGYMGRAVNGGGEIDHPFLSKLLVRRLTPQPTVISKKANVPGYTGHTHWNRILPAHSDLSQPNPLTSARTYREIPVEEERSPFRRTSPLSKTITLVSPYNPFNKIEY